MGTTVKKAIEKINAKFDKELDICPSCGEKMRGGICLKYRCQGIDTHKSLLEAITDNDTQAVKELEQKAKEGKIIRIM